MFAGLCDLIVYWLMDVWGIVWTGADNLLCAERAPRFYHFLPCFIIFLPFTPVCTLYTLYTLFNLFIPSYYTLTLYYHLHWPYMPYFISFLQWCNFILCCIIVMTNRFYLCTLPNFCININWFYLHIPIFYPILHVVIWQREDVYS
jgi:hypothetical protein